ncbi:MAG TPA: hypothetical protein VIK14_06595 [Ignavibacteria bacterium]
MSLLQFYTKENFSLETEGWGDVSSDEIIKLLENVITNFYEEFDNTLITNKPVYARNGNTCNPPLKSPFFKPNENYNDIYLTTRGRLWSQYSYQFAHELCHHVINSNMNTPCDRFGWLEESLCELASLYCIDKMSRTWKINAPFHNWKDYTEHFISYLKEVIEKPEHSITIPFKNCLKENIEELYKNRYKRTENCIIAINLLPMFKDRPEIWKTIQYFKKVNVTADMNLDEFMNNWRQFVPDKMKNYINDIEKLLNE